MRGQMSELQQRTRTLSGACQYLGLIGPYDHFEAHITYTLVNGMACISLCLLRFQGDAARQLKPYQEPVQQLVPQQNNMCRSS